MSFGLLRSRRQSTPWWMSFSSSKTAIPISRMPGSMARMRNGRRGDFFMASGGGFFLLHGLWPEVRESERDGVEDVHPLVFAHVDFPDPRETRAEFREALGDGLRDRL